jgi:hypothetical protein
MTSGRQLGVTSTMSVSAVILATERTRLEHIIVGVFTITSLFKIALLANAEKRDLQDVQQEHEEQRKVLHTLLRESGGSSDGGSPTRSARA